MNGLTIEHVSPATAVGSVGNVHVAVYRAALTMTELMRVHDRHLALLGQHERTCVLSLAEAGMPMPDADVRAMATKMGKELSTRIVCSGQVIAGEGFWTSAARSMLTAILWIQVGAYPTRVFADIVTASEWMAEHNRVKGPDAGSLAAALTALRTAN